MNANSLPHVAAKLQIPFNDANVEFEVKALLDSGATHSFLRLNSLPAFMQSLVKNFLLNPTGPNRLGLELMDLTIQTAVQETRSMCALFKANMRINEWEGVHQFIVTNTICKHGVILGYDFILKHRIDVSNPSQAFLGVTRLKPVEQQFKLRKLKKRNIDLNSSNNRCVMLGL